MKTKYFNASGLSRYCNIRPHALMVFCTLEDFPAEIEDRILKKLQRRPDINMVRQFTSIFNITAIGADLGLFDVNHIYKKPLFEGREEEVNKLFEN